jgi:ribosome-binding protein aMBF1 (putative translation factor)
VNRLPSGADKQERGHHLQRHETIGGLDETILPTDEDIRKQRLVIAEECAQPGPTMWDIKLVTAEHQSAEMKARSKSEIDEYIGARIREGRLSLNLSQEQLARALGVSFQQIQNYERGANGVSAVRLFDICKILNVSLASMFPADRAPDTTCAFIQRPMDGRPEQGMVKLQMAAGGGQPSR